MHLVSALNLLSVLLAAVSVGLFVLSIRRAFAVRRRARELDAIDRALTRALDQLDSKDSGDILSGLQTITMIKDDGAAVLALPRLAELRGSADARVARQAVVATRRVRERLAR